MNLDIVAEVWEVLRKHIDFNERKDAADSIVHYMIENNADPADIKAAFSFRGDKDIATALKVYADQQDDDLDEYDEDEDEPY